MVEVLGTLTAETTSGNAGAVALLRSLGVATEVEGERIRAELSLSA